jgi:hypothetical protein
MAYPDLLGHILKACSPVTQLGLSMVVKGFSEIMFILYIASYFFKIIVKVAISLDGTRDGIEFIHQGPEVVEGHIKPLGLPLKSAVIVKVYS